MIAGLALIVVYLIILGGVKGAVILWAAVLLWFLSPGILLALALSAPSLLKKLKRPLGMAVRAAKDLFRHLLRPPDR